MDNLKVGDVIVFREVKEEVRAVIDKIVFTRTVLDDGSVTPSSFHEIEDLITWGYKKQ